jgi:hypothetical protein
MTHVPGKVGTSLDVDVPLVPLKLIRPAGLLARSGTSVAPGDNGRPIGGARWSRVTRRSSVLGFAVRLLFATHVDTWS